MAVVYALFSCYFSQATGDYCARSTGIPYFENRADCEAMITDHMQVKPPDERRRFYYRDPRFPQQWFECRWRRVDTWNTGEP